ncbi:hypothetical protein CLOSTMETH_00546 [[Clostridium] methylpentosum DSM 5476]|uniref:Uncharacterized protein n=1 Tax=[Clostridium] methylpentosum DSM 5476 TaxID=537013 RepID=C0E9P7_9FIRM|nr:hypothetical protein CLOSTMETH_00546 [[Clostridium] methylpentosum DSM 5476]
MQRESVSFSPAIRQPARRIQSERQKGLESELCPDICEKKTIR